MPQDMAPYNSLGYVPRPASTASPDLEFAYKRLGRRHPFLQIAGALRALPNHNPRRRLPSAPFLYLIKTFIPTPPPLSCAPRRPPPAVSSCPSPRFPFLGRSPTAAIARHRMDFLLVCPRTTSRLINSWAAAMPSRTNCRKCLKKDTMSTTTTALHYAYLFDFLRAAWKTPGMARHIHGHPTRRPRRPCLVMMTLGALSSWYVSAPWASIPSHPAPSLRRSAARYSGMHSSTLPNGRDCTIPPGSSARNKIYPPLPR